MSSNARPERSTEPFSRAPQGDGATAKRGTAIFVGPHPDDIELFAGGTAARLARLGHRIILCDLTRGELATHGTPAGRTIEAEAARIALGAEERVNLGLPDGHLDARDKAALRALASCIREYKPDTLFAPSERGRHPDHEAAAALCRRAVFFAALKNGDADGEPHHVSLLTHYMMRIGLTPSFVVPLDATDIASKMQAIQAHGSQVGPNNDSDGSGAAPAATSHATEVPASTVTLVGEPHFLDVITARDKTF
ncbi:MAG: bacillithiol biosynthesis deacetylase BshB1, partial [Bradymonadia bacterium]